MACCVLHIGADAKVNDGNVEKKHHIYTSRVCLSKNVPASIVMFIHEGFNLPFYPLALSRKGNVSSTTNWNSLSRRGRASAW